MNKPILRNVTLQLTLKELAESLGKSDWCEMNEYLDCDLFPFWNGQLDYSKHGYITNDGHKLAVKYCPNKLDRAHDDAYRQAYEDEYGKCRRQWILDALSRIEESVEYTGEDSEGNEVEVKGINAGVKEVSLEQDIVTVELVNPEHFLNTIIMDLFLNDDVKVDVALSNENLKQLFLNLLKDYFRCFKNLPSDEFRVDTYPEDEDVTEMLKNIIWDNDIVEEIADKFLKLIGREDKEILKAEIIKLGEFLGIDGLYDGVEAKAKEYAEAEIEEMKAKLSKIA